MRLIAVAATIGGAVAFATVIWLAYPRAVVKARADAADAPRLPPLRRHVVVEVLNTGKVTGASRTATLLLRRAGLDVVSYGSDANRVATRNRILVVRGDTTGVGRAAAAIGGADIVLEPDSSWEADLVVLLGRNFAPPAAPVRTGT